MLACFGWELALYLSRHVLGILWSGLNWSHKNVKKFIFSWILVDCWLLEFIAKNVYSPILLTIKWFKTLPPSSWLSDSINLFVCFCGADDWTQPSPDSCQASVLPLSRISSIQLILMNTKYVLGMVLSFYVYISNPIKYIIH